MNRLDFSRIRYRAIRDRLLAEDPEIDEVTLADTVEGLTDLHDIVAAILRSALNSEALAAGLKQRIGEMHARLERLSDQASKRRQIARDVMLEADIRKITAPDFTASVRPGVPGVSILAENLIPADYWQTQDPKLNKQALLAALKTGKAITGAELSTAAPVIHIRTK
jgi:hypothetical protein